MRRLLTLATLICAIPTAFASAATAATPPISASVDVTARFPQRTLLVTLPPGVHPYNVTVTENGVPVIPHLEAVTHSRVPVSLVVAIDTSDSMRGAKLASAVDAARTLIAGKPARSEVEVIGFASQPTVLHGWSADPAGAMASLENVSTQSGTAIWDTVSAAAQQLSARSGAARAIVLLTDGMDTSSTATVRSAIAAVVRYHAHVDVVGLPGAPATAALRRLADGTGGEFVQVSSLGQLHQVYANLAVRLTQQYIVTYTSQLRGTGKPVNVRVSAGGSSVTRSYAIPPMQATATAAPRGWWTTNAAIAAVAGTVAVIIMLAAYAVLRPKPVRPSQKLRGYGTFPTRRSETPLPIVERSRRAQARPGSRQVWQRFVADVGRGELGRSASAILLGAVTAATLLAGFAALASGVVWVVVIGPPLGALAAWVFVSHRASAWYRHFDQALADHLVVLSSSLRAGHSLLQAVVHVAEEADEKTAAEWNELVRQTQVGMSVEDALDQMVVRVGNRDLQWISLVVRVQHQVGGNMAEMFDIVADTVRQRHRLRAQIQTLTAQGRMTRWILVAAPFAIGGVMFLLSPQYMVQFLDDPTGKLLIAIALVMSVIGSLWLKKIVEIEV